MNGKLLLVDDDKNICAITRVYLEKAGFSVDLAHDGQAALDKASRSAYDLALLDLMLPFVDGWTVCQTLRQTSSLPIIMMTAKGAVEDVIHGLRLGADDYIVKPFDPNELVARVETVLRRCGSMDAAEEQVIHAGGLVIHLDAREVRCGGEIIKVTPTEYDLLVHLASRPNRVFSREDLVLQVWGWDYAGDDRVVDLYIKRIRDRLPSEIRNVIQTVRGAGYKFKVADL